MRAFYLAYPAIAQTPSAKSPAIAVSPRAPDIQIVQSPIAQLPTPRFPLAWNYLKKVSFSRIAPSAQTENLRIYRRHKRKKHGDDIGNRRRPQCVGVVRPGGAIVKCCGLPKSGG